MSSTPTSVLPCSRKETRDDDIDHGGAAHHRCRRHPNQLPWKPVPANRSSCCTAPDPGVSALANWQHNIPTLAQRFRVLAPDIVGFGATERPDDIVYSLRTWTDHVWAFLDAHDIEKTAIVGNSLGGRIALQMAADRPDRITKMVLMGAPGVGMTPTEGLAALRAYEPSHDAMRGSAAQLLCGRSDDDHRRTRRHPLSGQHRRRRLRGVPQHVLRPAARRIRTRHHRKRGRAPSPHRHCSCTAARTRWYPCRSQSRCWGYCPTPICMCSAPADTGPRSSAPTSFPR